MKYKWGGKYSILNYLLVLSFNGNVSVKSAHGLGFNFEKASVKDLLEHVWMKLLYVAVVFKTPSNTY